MIEIRDLKKKYGERTVLDIPLLQIDCGSSTVLAGANGSGKTTLIKILAGTLKATEGSLALPQKIRYLPQQSYAFRGDLIKNITLTGADESTALRLLEIMELAHLKEKKASSLSGGELQRLSLCRVLAQKSDLLLLDEPTSSCDARGTQIVLNAINSYRKENDCTLIMSTHSPLLASAGGERLIILSDGEIVADGVPKEILTHPESEWAKSFIAGWKI